MDTPETYVKMMEGKWSMAKDNGWDRYFKKTDGDWGMIHIGCFWKAPIKKREEVFRDAVRERDAQLNIQLHAASRIGYPPIPCAICGRMGKLD